MRGQKLNDAQHETIARLRAKGWRGGDEGDMFAKQAILYRDRPSRFGRWPQYPTMPDPCVVHVDRQGRVHCGYSWGHRHT